MTRLVAVLFVLALALPYARAPLCQAGAHEHGDDRMAHHGAPALSGPQGGLGCHLLMGCQIGADLEGAGEPPVGEDAGRPTHEYASPVEAPPDIRSGPKAPPPRAI